MDWTIWPAVPSIRAWPYGVEPAAVVLELVMECDPMASPRPKFKRVGGAYMPKPYIEHRDLLGWRMKKFMTGRPPEAGAVGLKAWFLKKTRDRRDVDNYLKTVLDAGTGIIWEDDVQVVEAFGRCFYQPDAPKTVLLVYRTQA